MCGIAGFVDARQAAGAVDPPGGSTDLPRSDSDRDVQAVRRMCDVIRHRGPDDEGIHVEPGVGLGMRRLSIIDLVTGRQPITNEDRNVWVVFNGEIYNFQRLRAELEAQGHVFATRSDTEAIVHAYEQWGAAAFGRLRGMFAIALWDGRSRTLWLARDRAGIKPLHYALAKDGRLLFGSEIKSILVTGEIERQLDPRSLDHYLSFLYTPSDRSIFVGIRKLPPGHLLQWQDGRVRVTRYWQMSAAETFTGTEEEAADGLRAVLTDAVRAHLVSDVPLGAFLSGGVDSSVVVGLMAASSDRPVKTFSIGFEDPAFDELPHARQVARHFGTEHHEFIVRPDAAAILDDLIGHFDEPFGDASAIPTWYVSEIARQHVTVVLSGDGGDELFGGYDRYLPQPAIETFDRLPLPGRRRLASLVSPLLPHGTRGKRFLRHVSRDPRGRYLESIGFFQTDERHALLSPDLLDGTGATDVEQASLARFGRVADLPWTSQMMRFDFETYLPEDVLTKVDRMSMAHSIESRVPLLDNEVIDFAASLPAAFKISAAGRKRVLKRAATGLVPDDILRRGKQGFGVPVGAWFRGTLREAFADILLAPRTRQRGYFNHRFLTRLVDEHLSARRDHTLRLWLLLVFELWHRQYLDRAPADASSKGVLPIVSRTSWLAPDRQTVPAGSHNG